MKEEFIHMEVYSFSEIVGKYHKGIITLKEKDGNRFVPVVCDIKEKDRINAFLTDNAISIDNRFSGFRAFLKMIVPTLKKDYDLVVVKLIIGRYLACLCRKGNELPDLINDDMIRIEDAIIISHVAKMPLYMSHSLLKAQAIKVSPGVPLIALPYTVLSNDMLEEAYTKAIDDERYETAQVLKFELDRRKHLGRHPLLNDNAQ